MGRWNVTPRRGKFHCLCTGRGEGETENTPIEGKSEISIIECLRKLAWPRHYECKIPIILHSSTLCPLPFFIRLSPLLYPCPITQCILRILPNVFMEEFLNGALADSMA